MYYSIFGHIFIDKKDYIFIVYFSLLLVRLILLLLVFVINFFNHSELFFTSFYYLKIINYLCFL